MLAHPDPSSLSAAPVTPTQRALQAAHLERQRRLGLVPARPASREPVPETIAQQPAPVLQPRVAEPGPVVSAPLAADDSPRTGSRARGAVLSPKALAIAVSAGLKRSEMVVLFEVTHDALSKALHAAGLIGVPLARRRRAAAAEDQALRAMLAVGVPRAEIEARLGLSKTTLSKRIRAAGLKGAGKARLKAEAAVRAERETGQVRRGLKQGLSVAQLATLLGVSAGTVTRRILDAGLALPSARPVAPVRRQLSGEAMAAGVEAILADVAAQYGVTEAALISRSRAPGAAAARAMAAMRLLDELHLTFRDCGRVLGERDHSSIRLLYKRAKAAT